MPIFEMVIGGVTGFALGWIVCFRLGEIAREKAPWHYWVANAAIAVAGTVVIGIGLFYAFEWLWIGAMGFVTAGFAGLKYGRAKVVGRPGLTPPEPEERDIPRIWNE